MSARRLPGSSGNGRSPRHARTGSRGTGQPVSWARSGWRIDACTGRPRPVLGASLAITLVELLFFPTYFESSTLDPVTIGIAVSLGWYGNGLYKAHVERRIDKLRPNATSRESFLALLEAQGGTNWLAATGFAIATPLLGFLMIVIRNVVVGTY